MTPETKNPAGGPGSREQLEKSTRLDPTTKLARVLRVLLERGDRGLTCFQAVELAHDYVLRSTISELYHRYGVTFTRIPERVPGYSGSIVDCTRYVLDNDGRTRAAELLPCLAPAACMSDVQEALV